MRNALVILAALLAEPLLADIVVPVRNLRAETVISAQDLTVLERDVAGAVQSFDQLVGQEASVTLYAGRPVFPGDVRAPAIVTPNQFVSLVFTTSQLRIQVDGRALGRGGAGDRIRVMNLASRSTLFGVVQEDGTVLVKNGK
ncbi:flagellar basal body P-ring formation chaperone FlgA [Primorskyibacter aestuariivivens]|uniref:flagellar basal body P-ring formation chaperone FlgA n=1 Tax=Primorskyibacter aestuariivivens TaxID=1888912 RepID=UPI0022FFFC22|nr:flagellar basal body P-ring formation chaperone FlgA [Primorskyibacter aestuariivivens]MDA7430197.1 flagellar basal body P-ring formation chaperone FlgA [Primorskyibacter aestuariivivens]